MTTLIVDWDLLIGRRFLIAGHCSGNPSGAAISVGWITGTVPGDEEGKDGMTAENADKNSYFPPPHGEPVEPRGWPRCWLSHCCCVAI